MPSSASTYAATINTLYVLAGVALFTTGEAPVIQPSVKFLEDPFAMAWAGWKFAGCFYFAMVNWGVPLNLAGAAVQLPYIAFDVYAAHYHPEHWTPLAYSFIALEALTLACCLAGKLKVGAVINFLYCLAGVALFATGEAPVVNPDVKFLELPFAMAWAGWKFSGCLFFGLVNWGVPVHLSNFLTQIPYVAFDVFAVVYHPEHWTPLAGSFIVCEGSIALSSLYAHLSGSGGKPPMTDEQRMKDLESKIEQMKAEERRIASSNAQLEEQLRAEVRKRPAAAKQA